MRRKTTSFRSWFYGAYDKHGAHSTEIRELQGQLTEWKKALNRTG